MDKAPTQVRRIGPTRRSVSGRYAFRGTSSVPYESTLERDFVVRQEFRRCVLDVVAQPVTIHWRDDTGRARTYTPDYLVLFRADEIRRVGGPPSLLVEVKHREDLRRDWAALRPKFRAAVRHARAQGWRFSIQDEYAIRDQVFDNITFLKRYERMQFSAEDKRAVLDRIEFMGQSPIDYLVAVQASGPIFKPQAIALVWHLLATRQLDCDMCLPLDQFTVVWRSQHGPA